MYKFAFFSLFFMFSANSMADGEVAICNTSLNGYSYYPKDAAIESDSLKNFNLIVRRIDKEKFDVLFVDSSKSVKTATQQGGAVMLLERGMKAFSILVNYPGHSSDIYTFTKGNKNTVVIQTIRSGDQAAFPKNSLLTGVCQQINIPN